MEELYYIMNIGCDDVTHGLAIIPKEFFNTFKEIIENLNENSQYSCMPTIEVYKINKDILREATDNDKPYNILHLGEKKYVLKELIYDYKTDNYIKGVDQII